MTLLWHAPSRLDRRHRWRPSYALAIIVMWLIWAASATAEQKEARLASPHDLCEAAIAVAVQGTKVPANLTLSIARAESGRLDPATGRARPWPWTINAGGTGTYFATKEAAVAAVAALQARGVTVVDVGCMQVNLRHHPSAFADLHEAFDPATNANYAVRFLTTLHRQTGDWVQATAFYHSQTQGLGDEYVRRVLGPGARPLRASPLPSQAQRAAWLRKQAASIDPEADEDPDDESDDEPPGSFLAMAPGVSTRTERVPGLACRIGRC